MLGCMKHTDDTSAAMPKSYFGVYAARQSKYEHEMYLRCHRAMLVAHDKYGRITSRATVVSVRKATESACAHRIDH